MTTIAFDGNVLAVDSGVWNNDMVGTAKKLFIIEALNEGASQRLYGRPDAGRVIWAASGDVATVPLVVGWMKGEYPLSEAKQERNGNDGWPSIGLLLCEKTRAVGRLNKLLTLEPLLGVPVTDGGGHEIAMGAMLAGASAARAVEIAGQCSTLSFGEVICYQLPDIGSGIVNAQIANCSHPLSQRKKTVDHEGGVTREHCDKCKRHILPELKTLQPFF